MFVLLIGLFFLSPNSYAKVPATVLPAQAKKQFVRSCEASFKKSQADGDTNFGKTICECAAEESQSQGVSLAALTHESEQIEKNPKYEIQDEKLMNSIRYCVLTTMRPKMENPDASVSD